MGHGHLKRAACLLLAGALAMGCFSACGGTGQAPPESPAPAPEPARPALVEPDPPAAEAGDYIVAFDWEAAPYRWTSPALYVNGQHTWAGYGQGWKNWKQTTGSPVHVKKGGIVHIEISGTMEDGGSGSSGEAPRRTPPRPLRRRSSKTGISPRGSFGTTPATPTAACRAGRSPAPSTGTNGALTPIRPTPLQ